MGEKCIAIKPDGQRCKSWAVKNMEYCRHHLDEMEAAKPAETEEGITSTEPEKKEATKPWSDFGNPWKHDLLRLNRLHSGFRAKWANRHENIRKYLDIGYVYADRKDYGELHTNIPGEEAKDGTRIIRRELVLMEIPEHLIKLREQYIDEKTNRAIKEANQPNDTSGLKRLGSRYDPRIEHSFDSRRGGP